MQNQEPTLGAELLRGARAIAAFVYDHEDMTRQVYHLREMQKSGRCDVPLFVLNGVLCARKSALMRWIEAQEAA